MKKAVIIFAHNLPEQLNLFTKQLTSDGTTDVFIHVSKANENIRGKIVSSNHIFITNNNITTTWGSDELLKAILNMIAEVLNSSEKYEYLLICSGQDLLVRKGLDSFLESNNGKVFINGWADDKRRRAFLLYKWPSKYRQLINSITLTRVFRRMRIFLFTHGFPFCKKKVKFDVSQLVFYKSYFWCALPRDVAEYISQKSNDSRFMSIYEGGFVAEEGFLLTVIMNSSFSDRVEFEDGITKGITYTKPFINNHPPIIENGDVEQICNSGAFFARKFNINSDKDVVDYYVKMFEDS